MKTQDQRIAEMTFASVYPMYVEKVITWLTGFDNKTLQQLIKDKVTSFDQAGQVFGQTGGRACQRPENGKNLAEGLT